jgi:DNA-binding XRE family transcriptional regulator
LAFYGLEISIIRQSASIENPKTVGEHIRKRRQGLKLLQVDVAKIFDVCEDTITGWENDRNKPLIHHYPKIIEFLGYNPFPFDTSTLGGRMRKYRIENGISQEALANMVGVNETTILSWERNTHKPFPKKLKLLEEIINPKEPSQ